MTDGDMHTPRDAEFAEIDQAAVYPENTLSLDDLREVKMQLTADLGRTRMVVRDLLELRRGSVIALSKTAGEMTDLYINGQFLGRGEVVVINDTLHVRIAEVGRLGMKPGDQGTGSET